MCLRFVFLLAVQIPAWLRLSRRPPAWKDAEILLRHQLAVLQRQTAARPKLTWPDRALFAALLTLIPRSRHDALHSFITPGTILRWHHDIVRSRWAAKSKPKRPGRPPTHRHIVRLVLRMAADNEHWGYRRIAGELAGLGIAVAPSTVWEILKRHGIDPAPRRAGPDWAQFLRSQADADVKFVLHDRDATFHEGFDAVLANAGIEVAKDPTPEPARERFCRTVRAHRPDGDHRPDADLRRTAPADDPD